MAGPLLSDDYVTSLVRDAAQTTIVFIGDCCWLECDTTGFFEYVYAGWLSGMIDENLLSVTSEVTRAALYCWEVK